ncbi:YrdB family protein [Nocardia sp. NBC_01327]|uniref:YrdB family protein n=1 Tax=Nocardia sp. NBC_01327 TaxID=2903593 RepID=UPI002E0D18A7|nr:YrdB family protein [Nocardia sp. NBC_01327]
MTVLKGANLLLMFVLELCVLGSAGWWGFGLDAPILVRIVAGIAAIAVFVAVWAIFGAAHDARIPVRGWKRAVLEIVWFGGAGVLLGFAWTPIAGLVLFLLWLGNAGLRLLWGQVYAAGAEAELLGQTEA